MPSNRRCGLQVAEKLMQNRQVPSAFRTSTGGARHGESEYSMMPFSSSFCVSSLIVRCSSGEYRRYLHCTGTVLGSFNSIFCSTPAIAPGCLGFLATTSCNAYKRHDRSLRISVLVLLPKRRSDPTCSNQVSNVMSPIEFPADGTVSTLYDGCSIKTHCQQAHVCAVCDLPKALFGWGWVIPCVQPLLSFEFWSHLLCLLVAFCERIEAPGSQGSESRGSKRERH